MQKITLSSVLKTGHQWLTENGLFPDIIEKSEELSKIIDGLTMVDDYTLAIEDIEAELSEIQEKFITWLCFMHDLKYEYSSGGTHQLVAKSDCLVKFLDTQLNFN